MAISAKAVWEVRPSGSGASDTNGGGFVSDNTGTDFSQQDSKNTVGSNISTTDAVANGTTTITSATASFTSAIVGNIFYFAGGSASITGQWRHVTAFTNSTTITIDTAIAASTGMTMNIGGALATLTQAIANLVTGNIVHIKAGTYTQTAAITFPSVSATIIGYQTARNDWGTPPLLTTATNSVHLLDLGGSNTITFKNISLSNTATRRSFGIVAIGSGVTLNLVKCSFDGFTYAVNGENSTWWPFVAVNAYRCEFKNCSTYGIINQNPVTARNCYFRANTTASIAINASSITVDLNHNIFAGGQYGLYYAAGQPGILKGFNNVFANQTGSAVEGAAVFVGSGLYWENNIVYGAGAWALDFATGSIVILNENNAYGANVSGNLRNISVGVNDVSLTADPFTNTAGGDYSLNSAAGGGALCKAAGYPGAFPGGTSTGYLDIGALQSQGSGGGTSGAANYGFIG
jgi:hypothetical protein